MSEKKSRGRPPSRDELVRYRRRAMDNLNKAIEQGDFETAREIKSDLEDKGIWSVSQRGRPVKSVQERITKDIDPKVKKSMETQQGKLAPSSVEEIVVKQTRPPMPKRGPPTAPTQGVSLPSYFNIGEFKESEERLTEGQAAEFVKENPSFQFTPVRRHDKTTKGKKSMMTAEEKMMSGKARRRADKEAVRQAQEKAMKQELGIEEYGGVIERGQMPKSLRGRGTVKETHGQIYKTEAADFQIAPEQGRVELTYEAGRTRNIPSSLENIGYDVADIMPSGMDNASVRKTIRDMAKRMIDAGDPMGVRLLNTARDQKILPPARPAPRRQQMTPDEMKYADPEQLEEYMSKVKFEQSLTPEQKQIIKEEKKQFEHYREALARGDDAKAQRLIPSLDALSRQVDKIYSDYRESADIVDDPQPVSDLTLEGGRVGFNNAAVQGAPTNVGSRQNMIEQPKTYNDDLVTTSHRTNQAMNNNEFTGMTEKQIGQTNVDERYYDEAEIKEAEEDAMNVRDTVDEIEILSGGNRDGLFSANDLSTARLGRESADYNPSQFALSGVDRGLASGHVPNVDLGNVSNLYDDPQFEMPQMASEIGLSAGGERLSQAWRTIFGTNDLPLPEQAGSIMENLESVANLGNDWFGRGQNRQKPFGTEDAPSVSSRFEQLNKQAMTKHFDVGKYNHTRLSDNYIASQILNQRKPNVMKVQPETSGPMPAGGGVAPPALSQLRSQEVEYLQPNRKRRGNAVNLLKASNRTASLLDNEFQP